jgi:hypothetical protein
MRDIRVKGKLLVTVTARKRITWGDPFFLRANPPQRLAIPFVDSDRTETARDFRQLVDRYVVA